MKLFSNLMIWLLGHEGQGAILEGTGNRDRLIRRRRRHHSARWHDGGHQARYRWLAGPPLAIDRWAAARGSERQRAEAANGPIVYMAAVFGVPVELAIRWLILLMVLTCDPTAIALTVAASRRELPPAVMKASVSAQPRSAFGGIAD